MGERRYTRCEVSGYIATVRLDYPPLNLIREEMKEELFAILDRLKADAAVRVVILTGAGEKAFCAGRDLNQTRSWQESDCPFRLNKP